LFPFFRTAVLFTRKQQNVLKKPELQLLKDDSLMGSLGLGQDVEMKPEEKKKRGRKPGSRKSTEVAAAAGEPKKSLLL
jgi:hypothetical protein